MKEYDELINKLGETLTNEEQTKINELIRTDKEFGRELEAQKDIIEYLKYRKKILKLENYHQEMLEESGNTQFVPFRKVNWFQLTAVALLIIAAVLAFIKFF